MEHRQAEQALRDSERNYRDLINNLDAGVLVYDTTGKILLGNYSAAHILGLQPQELQNQTLHTAPWILHDEQGQILTEDQIPFSQVVQTGKAVENHIIRVQQAHRHRMSWILVNAFPKRSTDGTLHQVVVTFTDITQLKQAEDKLRHSSFHDTLTSLPNRALLLEHLDTCIQQTQSGRIPCLAVVFLDLDRFKVINDSLGHLFGDQVLIQVAILLQELVRSDDLVCRFGGDEFVIVLSAIPDTSVGIAKVQKIQAALSQPIEVQDHEVSIAASIGVTFSHGEYSRAEDLLRDADIAMYQAKAQGRNCYTVFDQGMHQQAMQRLQLEKDLRLALRSNEMELYYQPIVHRSVDPDRWELEGFEVLVRWNHPRLGLLTPNKFLDLAEETRLILPLNNWVIQRACEQLRHWSHQFPGLQHLRLSVNLAASQLQDVRFIDWLTQTLATTGVSPRQLSLEVTESVLLEDLTEVVAVLDRLRQLGFKISLDDFGTGYSSLNYLQQFPIDILKIDRSFVQGLGIGQSQPQSPSQAPAQLHAQSQAHAQSPLKFQDSSHDAPNPLQPNHKGFNIIQAIVSLAHALELVVVAEGIENLEEQRLLHSLDCDALQGYYISRPLPQASATQWLAQAQSGGDGNEPVGEAL
ncbi:MAG: putative bifunctional diguanylate cyclase/phosphodiesterase [Prochlorothrix sp.]